MFEKKLKEDLFDKIPLDSTIVIFGSGVIAEKMYNDIKDNRSDVFVKGFIENKLNTTIDNLPKWRLKEFIDSNLDVDLVVFSTRTDFEILNNILDVCNIPFLTQSEFVSNYYRKIQNVFNEKIYNSVMEMYEKKEDKDLFKLIFQVRTRLLPSECLTNFYNNKYNKDNNFLFNKIKYHYLEKLNKSSVKKVIDVGMSYGLNIIAFNKQFNNLERIYGFEAIYDKARIPYIEDFILNEKLEIIPLALGEKEGTTSFLINNNASTCSLCEDLTSMNVNLNNVEWTRTKINITTMDKFCFENNIKPDFIKMDIEGAELSALKGGIETIKRHRPQLAISIYHSDEDFINIPLYLKENLKNYTYALGHYSSNWCETVLYAIPKELA